MINGSHPAVEPTIFIVDDDLSVRTALERLFKASGWNVRTFASAEEFLRQNLRPSSGCLIADVHLGRMSGFDLLEALSHGAQRLPVILTSGVDDLNMEIEARRLGAKAFFRKPFDIGSLLDAVKRGMAS
jgi:FixJ family two-component response regulator